MQSAENLADAAFSGGRQKEKKSKVNYGMVDYRYSSEDIKKPSVSNRAELVQKLGLEQGLESSPHLKSVLGELTKHGLENPKVLSYLHRIGGRHGSETLEAISSRLSEFSKQCKDPQKAKAILDDALHDMAFPSNIDQGDMSTCGPTAAQMMLAAHRPEEYTRILTGLASGESVKLKGGRLLKPNTESVGNNDDGRTLSCKLMQDSFSKSLGCRHLNQGTTSFSVGPLMKQLYGDNRMQGDTFAGHTPEARWRYMEDDIAQGWPVIVGFRRHWVLAVGIDRTGDEPKMIANTWGKQMVLGKKEFKKQNYAVIDYDDEGADDRRVPDNTLKIIGDR